MADKTFNGIQFPNKTSGQGRNSDAGFLRLYFKNGNIYTVDENGTDTQLTGLAETDPIFLNSAASNITNTNITNWNTAYSWGDHSAQGYLTGVSLNQVSDVTINSPADNQILVYSGGSWVNQDNSGGNSSVTISNSAPASPSEGDLWWDEDLGTMFVYYNDGDSVQWVQSSPQSGTSGSGIALTDLSIGTDATASGAGGIEYDDQTGVFTYTPPDLSSYLTSETNDLTASVTWANVPDANITESSVTQHQAALSITESQISDLGTYLTSETDPIFSAHTTSNISDGTGFLRNNGAGTWSYDNSTYLTSIPAEYLTQTEGDSRYIQTGTNEITLGDANVTRFRIPGITLDTNTATDGQILQWNTASVGFDWVNPLDQTQGVTVLSSVADTLNTKTGATGVVDHDFTTGAVWYHSNITSDFTVNFINVPTDDNRILNNVIFLSQGATAYIPNAVQIDGVAQTINWSGAALPTGNANQLDIVSFSLIRTGSAWTVIGSLDTFA